MAFFHLTLDQDILNDSNTSDADRMEQEPLASASMYPGYLPYIEGLISISSVVQSGIAFLIREFLGPEHIWDLLINSRT